MVRRMGTEVIDLQTFIRNLRSNLDDPLPDDLDADTRIEDLPDWSSLKALIVVASFEWDYGVTLPAVEFRRAATLSDLYDIVIRKPSR